MVSQTYVEFKGEKSPLYSHLLIKARWSTFPRKSSFQCQKKKKKTSPHKNLWPQIMKLGHILGRQFWQHFNFIVILFSRKKEKRKLLYYCLVQGNTFHCKMCLISWVQELLLAEIIKKSDFTIENEKKVKLTWKH